MDVICIYTSNRRALGLMLEQAIQKSDLRLVPVRGTVTISEKCVKCLGITIECLAVPVSGPALLFTDNEKFSAENKKHITYTVSVDSGHSNWTEQLLSLCANKYSHSKNPFCINCSSDGHTVAAEANGRNAELKYIIKTPAGDMMASVGTDVPTDLFVKSKSLKSFSYTVSTDTFERDVAVRSGQLEILREISRYTGDTLILVDARNSDFTGTSFSDILISSTGCGYMATSNTGDFYTKREPVTSIHLRGPYLVYGVHQTLENFIRKQTIRNVLRH